MIGGYRVFVPLNGSKVTWEVFFCWILDQAAVKKTNPPILSKSMLILALTRCTQAFRLRLKYVVHCIVIG